MDATERAGTGDEVDGVDGVVGRLRGLFAPKSVALVGATDNSQWSVFTHANLRRYSPDVTVHLVHPRHEHVHGQPVHHSMPAIGEPVDLAYVMVPTAAVIEVVEEIADVGTRNLVILTAGFEEAGAAGAALASRLEQLATDRDLTVLGPNGNGFINVAGRVAAYGLPIAPPLVQGPVGIVLQSGGLAAGVLSGAQARGVGLSLMVSTGNEALISATDIMRYLIEDEHTKVIAAFLESVRHPEDFRDVAARALQAGKPIVALKAGRSEQGARTALAHTGALAGDDRIIDAAFRQLGVVRVDSLEELLATAGYLGYHPDVKGRRMAAVTPSGGACDLLADRAASEGLELPEFSDSTMRALTEFLPPFSNPHNPLDVTGYVLVDPSLPFQALQIVAKEAAGHFDMIVYAITFPRIAPKDLQPLVDRLDALASARQGIPVPVLLQTSVVSDLPAYAQELFEPRGLYILDGIELGTRAIGHGARYHERRERYLAARATGPPQPVPLLPVRGRGHIGHTSVGIRTRSVPKTQGAPVPSAVDGVWPEHRARALLEAHDIPVAPATLATSAAHAAALAADYAQPVAMKIASDQVAHKSDVGGVRLDVDPARAAATFRELAAALEAYRPGAPLDGVLVGPMRRGGTELLVGVVTDPEWGQVLSVGLGGVWVEVLNDVSLRLLPVDETDVAEMLGELRGRALLQGARHQTPADLDRLGQVIADIARLAAQLGPALDTIEINPLRVDGADVEVLDALIVWKDPPP